MKFVFYQNFLSIHQAAFLNALAENHQVTLIVEELIDLKRVNAGWYIPSMEKVEVLSALPSRQLRSFILCNQDAIHVFSGFDATKNVFYALKFAIRLRCHVIVYLEPLRFNDRKAAVRKLKYRWFNYRYSRFIDALLPTGRLGCDCYLGCGFPVHKIFEWGYFIGSDFIPGCISDSDIVKILFIGSLDTRKNVIPLIQTLKRIPNKFHCSLIGDGPLSASVQQETEGDVRFQFIGTVHNREINNYIVSHDILVLPSLFDGWGAVVNEALSCGTRVVVSENCGAACLVGTHSERGEIFHFHGEGNLENVLRRQLARGAQTPDQRQALQSWARTHISGETAAEYFTAICLYLSGRGERPIPPWREGE